MAVGRLTSLQVDVLKVLAPIRPSWTLTGGAALAGWYTQHRTTRDLDRALADAPRKDGGFSPLTLAWVLRNLPIRVLAGRLGTPADEAAALA